MTEISMKIMSIDLYKLGPPIISIAILLTSDFSANYLKKLVSDYIAKVCKETGSNDLIAYESRLRDVAADAAVRVSFFNSVIISLSTIVSALSGVRVFEWLAAVCLIVFVLLLVTLSWIISKEPGELTSHGYSTLRMSGGQFCRLLLIAWNVLLIVVIIGAQIT
jgi:hypothetical protein